MGTGAIIGIVVGVVVLILIIAIIAAYNGLVKLRNNAEEAFSTMDVYMKKRYDLIPNIVETVKGYAKHEKETLENVIKARNSAVASSTAEDRIAKDGMVTQALKQLAVVVEQYPELKANQNFSELQQTLKETEAEIANSRKYYNGTVKAYNVKREVFPTNIIAGLFKFTKKPLYEVESAEERKAVKVEF